MRPEQDNIGAPDLPPGIPWIGEEPRSMPMATAAGPALVHFFDFAQLNSVRTLPYLVEWDRRYRDAGLTTIGVQAPRFPFGADPAAVATGLERLGVEFPVAIDADRRLWHAYGCEGWPSLFLWSLGGALTWFHFGEGEYLATEEAIQGELRELDALRELPAPPRTAAADRRPRGPGDGAEPGGDARRLLGAALGRGRGRRRCSSCPTRRAVPSRPLEGSGSATVELDGGADGVVEVDGAGLYPLVEHPRHESHRLTLRPSPGLRVWSLSFAAGVP